jgi:hypothetical protein
MIGRNGHRRWPEVMSIVRRIWPQLPPDKQFDHTFQRSMRHFQDWDCSVVGFEGIRSQDVLRTIAERFDVARFVAWGGLSDVFLSYRTGPSFSSAVEADRQFLGQIQRLETQLLKERRTTPTEMAAEFRSRRSTRSRDPVVMQKLWRAVRQPGEVLVTLDDIAFTSPYPAQPLAILPILSIEVDHTFQAGARATQALVEGFDEPDTEGVWALLDEQLLCFQVDEPAGSVEIKLWSLLPAMRRQGFKAEAAGCTTFNSGPVDTQCFVNLVLTSNTGPRKDWAIRVFADAYRIADLDGGPDWRPLTYRLASICARR